VEQQSADGSPSLVKTAFADEIGGSDEGDGRANVAGSSNTPVTELTVAIDSGVDAVFASNSCVGGVSRHGDNSKMKHASTFAPCAAANVVALSNSNIISTAPKQQDEKASAGDDDDDDHQSVRPRVAAAAYAQAAKKQQSIVFSAASGVFSPLTSQLLTQKAPASRRKSRFTRFRPSAAVSATSTASATAATAPPHLLVSHEAAAKILAGQEQQQQHTRRRRRRMAPVVFGVANDEEAQPQQQQQQQQQARAIEFPAAVSVGSIELLLQSLPPHLRSTQQSESRSTATTAPPAHASSSGMLMPGAPSRGNDDDAGAAGDNE
jgi:hypothetical protein